MTYLGLSKDAWDLLFKAVTLGVLLIGVPITLHTLRQSVLQKLNDSLSKLLEEYRGKEFRDSVRNTIEKFPIFEGPIEQKVEQFLSYGSSNLRPSDIQDARAVVHKLNDIGAFIERRAVRESDFYGHTYPRLIELSARLEPLILAVSASSGFRWGMRIRRLDRGAKRYYSASKIHSSKAFAIDGTELISEGRTLFLVRWWYQIRKYLGFGMYTPSARATLEEDRAALRAAELAIVRAPQKDRRFLRQVV